MPMIRATAKDRIFSCTNLRVHVTASHSVQALEVPTASPCPHLVAYMQMLTTIARTLPRQMGNRLESHSQVLCLLSPSLSFARTSHYLHRKKFGKCNKDKVKFYIKYSLLL